MKKQRYHYVYHFAVYLFAFFCLRAVHWGEMKFGPLTIDQIFFHLNFGGEMLLKVDRSLVTSAIKNVLLVPLILALLALALDIRLTNRNKAPGALRPDSTPGQRPPSPAVGFVR